MWRHFTAQATADSYIEFLLFMLDVSFVSRAEHAECPRGLIAVLTCAVGSASKRSLIVMTTVSGPVPCSGAKRRGKVLDGVSTAIPGDEVAGNK